ncbi:MAG TPA: carboxylesterase family protein [Polyangiales bacterium]|nr:carboxylesterase family protein [Polyangiales bacterium]
MNLRCLFFTVCIGMTVGACSNDSNQGSTDGSTSDVVTVPDVGMIHGAVSAGMRSFKGIPYAAPPVGPLRWKPPQKAAPLSGTFDASKFGSGCVQSANSFGTGSTDEDCLFLNVYTPTGPGPYPVMFWIHGGAFLNGDATPYDPTKLVAQGVVVVTINYRLGMFGFLAHPAIDNGAGVASTNYGLLDQQFALQWVQDNIASFGGDETNVTIFGESAGGFSVHSQLVMPGAHGLFQKAIVESGAYGDANQPTLDDAKTQGTMFATSAKCADPCTADALRAIKASDVLAAQEALNLSTLIPSVDGTVIPTAVGTALGSGAYEKVPVIEGSNHDEWALFVAIYLIQSNLKLSTEMDYETAAAATLGVSSSIAQGLTAEYPLANYMNDPAVALTAAGTDIVFACPSRAAAIQFSANATTYKYEFSDENAPEGLLPTPPSDPGFKYGAAHASEIQFLFNTPAPAGQMLSTDEQALSTTMVKYWTQFAKTGDPNASGNPTWPKYTMADDSILTLNTPASAVAVETDFKTEHMCQ